MTLRKRLVLVDNATGVGIFKGSIVAITEYFSTDRASVFLGDSLEFMRGLPVGNENHGSDRVGCPIRSYLTTKGKWFMVTLNKSLEGESVQNTNRLTLDHDEIREDLRQRLYAADTILKFAARSLILPFRTRNRFLQLSGRLMLELDMLGGKPEDGAAFNRSNEQDDDDDGLDD